MIQTKRQIVQEALYEAYGGITSTDVRISERFVLTKLNNKIAAAGTINAFQNKNLEGVTYLNDTFYSTYNDLPVTDDTHTGFKKIDLPALPIGVPSQRSISLYPPKTNKCNGMNSTMFVMMPREQVRRSNNLPKTKTVYCFEQDGTIQMIIPDTLPLLEVGTMNLVMATSDGGLDSKANIPPDMLDPIKKELVAELRAIILGVPLELKNDGIEILEPRP